MTEGHAQDARPIERVFVPPPARPLLWRNFMRWLRTFSWRSGVSAAVLAAAVAAFWLWKDPWTCTGTVAAQYPEDDPAATWDRVAALSPDCSRFALARQDGAVEIRDATSGGLQTTLRFHCNRVHLLSWSRDGRRLASTDYGPKPPYASGLAFWDMERGEILSSMTLPEYATFLTLSPDGNLAAVGKDDGHVQLWDTAAGASRNQWTVNPSGRFHDGRFSDDGERLFYWWAGGAEIRHVPDGKQICSIPQRGGQDWIKKARISPDFSTIVTSHEGRSGIEPRDEVIFWDARTGPWLPFLARPSGVLEDGHFSPDGERLLAVRADGYARMWDVHTALPVAGFDGVTGVTSFWIHFGGTLTWPCAWSPDGRRLLIARYRRPSRYQYVSRADVLDAATGRLLASLGGHEVGLQSVAFSADGGRAMTVDGRGGVRLWRRRWEEPAGGVFAGPVFWLMSAAAGLWVFCLLRDTLRSLPPERRRSLPRCVRLAAFAFGLMGAIALVDLIGNLLAGEFRWPDAAALPAVPVAIGLLRRNRFWRIVGLLMLWLAIPFLVWSGQTWSQELVKAEIAPWRGGTFEVYGLPLRFGWGVVLLLEFVAVVAMACMLVSLLTPAARRAFKGRLQPPAPGGDDGRTPVSTPIR